MSVKIENLTHVYSPKTPSAFTALKNINLEFDDHVFIALVGETGSGKSTLIQHLNGLLIPTEGCVYIKDYVIGNKKRKNKNLRELRHQVGLVFQFPEYQLFESTVEKDVMVGPKNFKMKDEQAREAAHEALDAVGIGPEFYSRSPFDLSGGEKRRVAIAGILAMKPDILILDEPVAGLDPAGVTDIMNLLVKLYNEGTSIILVTHDMDLVLEYANQVFALHNGELIYEGTPKNLFSSITEDMALEIPTIYTMINQLNKRGYHLNSENITNIEELVASIVKEKESRHE
ncbi:MAG: energy-coupling factor transporter ATPase [Coprobacillus sp.]|nr:energy-coupling factor transporter ATPase [Coprobacillus sp.]